MSIKHVQEVPSQPVKAGKLTTIQVLQEGPNLSVRRSVMKGGGGMPNHTNTMEYEQYLLKGQASIGIEDEVIK